jgi:hypothetical protein
MSAAQPYPPPVAHAVPNEITVVSHSNLFYWWPVWAVGFLLALLTLYEGHRMVTVPSRSEAAVGKRVTIEKADGSEQTFENREVVVLPKGEKLARQDPRDSSSPIAQPRLHMARGRGYGVIFAFVLLVVIVITNVPLRGMWSLMVVVLLVLLALIFRLAGWWDPILFYLSLLDIRINLGGYMMISLVLFGIWLLTFVFFDRQIYVTFTPGQLKVRTEIGGGEKVYDAVGMTLEKQRSDLFRHWILGLGSGDLIVKTSGAQAHQFDLPNVLFITKKVEQIEDMLKKKAVVETR